MTCPRCTRLVCACPPPPSALARFAIALAAHVHTGRSLDEAAREAAPIARTEAEA